MAKLQESLKKLLIEKRAIGWLGSTSDGYNQAIDAMSANLSKAEVDVEKLAKWIFELNGTISWETLPKDIMDIYLEQAKSIAEGIELREVK